MVSRDVKLEEVSTDRDWPAGFSPRFLIFKLLSRVPRTWEVGGSPTAGAGKDSGADDNEDDADDALLFSLFSEDEDASDGSASLSFCISR